MAAFNAVMLGTALYRGNLVPRWMPARRPQPPRRPAFGANQLRFDAVAISDSIAVEMKQLIVRNVDEETVRALKQRAARRGTSAEAEHRAILRDALRSDIDRASFKHFLASMPDAGLDEEFVVVRDMPRDPA